ncbi:sensor histidine kinase [Shimia ponticola]|uniref:sensor histidine kinase n=1 Tax=Shimia ponticola TaxID=2582893 RepID=UPI0011BEF77A|nr:sensor histidine kinase [Shimia ponticola]
MKTSQSLRTRLTVIILVPLLAVSVVAGAWQFSTTADRAESIFDRGLLSAALAISRDVAVTGGDALSPTTRRLVNDTSGGELFYHVFAPDGVFVTGYATPPVPAGRLLPQAAEPIYFDATYLGEPVRVLRYSDVATVDGLTGTFNITVWQSADVRSTFVREVVSRSFAVIALLVACVALIVWFGVGVGLRPLLELEGAIARRSSTDLTPIRRSVPVETKGLVETLNRLFDQVSRRISSKDEFISNAAHQLRNPIAGVLALAEAVQSAPNEGAARRRSGELLDAARETSQLANQLLSFERARGADVSATGRPLDLAALGQDVVAAFSPEAEAREVSVTYEEPGHPIHVLGDAVMLREAVLNLLRNALLHGGRDLSRIRLMIAASGPNASLSVEDDGVGIPPEKHLQARSRFGQAGGVDGSGLGLPIAVKVAQNHGGELKMGSAGQGLTVEILIPLLADADERGE